MCDKTSRGQKTDRSCLYSAAASQLEFGSAIAHGAAKPDC